MQLARQHADASQVGLVDYAPLALSVLYTLAAYTPAVQHKQQQLIVLLLFALNL